MTDTTHDGQTRRKLPSTAAVRARIAKNGWTNPETIYRKDEVVFQVVTGRGPRTFRSRPDGLHLEKED